MGLISPTLPTVGSEGRGAGEVDVRNALSTILTEFNGNITDANIKSTAAIADSKLAAPASAIWKTLAQVPFQFRSSEGSAAVYGLNEVGNTFIGGIGSNGGLPIYLDAADFTMTGRTPKLRLRVQAVVGGAPGITFTFGIYPITVTNSAGTAVLTPGTVIAGSTAAIATPGANSKQLVTSSTISFPTADQYIVAVALSGATAAASNMVGRVLLQMSHA
jgi:hypothetical protein